MGKGIQAVVLSGGKGTRLRPLTDTVPKPMLHVGDRPHLQHIIELLRKHGIKDIIFSTGYLHDNIVDYFGDGSKFGVNISYKEDGEIPLGTAGAIKNCEDLIRESSVDEFLVFNGDILTNMFYPDLIMEHAFNHGGEDGITVTLIPVSDPSSFGVARMSANNENQIVEFIEKPTTLAYGNLINAGIYMMNVSVLDSIPKGEFCMLETDIFPKYANSGKLYGHADKSMYWLDIGTLERYEQANNDFVAGKLNREINLKL